jgi:hypothetical protein
VVIGLQSTGEAAADSLGLQPGDQCGFISTTRQLLLHFVETHFPTTLALEESQQQQEQQEGEQGEPQGGGSWGGGSGGGEDASPGGQQQGQGQQQGGEEEPTSVQLKATLLERIAGLDLPPNFLDEVRRHLCLPAWCPTACTRISPRFILTCPITLPCRSWTAWVAWGQWRR